ncbi:hypothetical protein FRC12_000732 [Ceratobasidium sp. 428]|nr:hypothetical protein FRC12_000732 [Ceratobasidium sp. 428]
MEPGADELNVVLTFVHRLDFKCSHEIRALFERGNVTRLNLCSMNANDAAQFLSCSNSVSSLQKLSLSYHMRSDGSASLSALLVTSDNGEALARFPNLRYLTISQMIVDQVQLKQIVNIYQLSSIALGYNLDFQGGPRGSMSDKDFLDWLRQRVDVVTSLKIDNEQYS